MSQNNDFAFSILLNKYPSWKRVSIQISYFWILDESDEKYFLVTIIIVYHIPLKCKHIHIVRLCNITGLVTFLKTPSRIQEFTLGEKVSVYGNGVDRNGLR